MTEYKDLTLEEIMDYAEKSSSELASIGDNLVNYETGKQWFFADEDTTLFLASARVLVIELVRRLRKDVELPPHLHVQYICELCQETTNEPDTHRYCTHDEV